MRATASPTAAACWSRPTTRTRCSWATATGFPAAPGRSSAPSTAGTSWEAVALPEPPNSVVYWLATHRAAPDVIVGVSLFGYVYLSEDGGQNWRKLDREFGEVRSVAVTAN